MFESIACLITEMLAYSQGKCHIREHSSGKGNIMQTTLVFIPGLLLTADLYAHQTEALKGAYPIHHAETKGMDTITAMAERALDETSGKILPIGLSMGGYITLEIARLAPDRLAGIVVMDSAANADDDDKIMQRKALIEMSKIGKFKGVTRTLLPNLIAPQHLEDENLSKPIMAMAEEVGQENFTHQQIAIMGRRDQFDTLQRLNVPSLFMVGAHDALTPPKKARDMAAAAKNSRYVEIADAGHLPTMEAPDAVNQALIEFLNEITI